METEQNKTLTQSTKGDVKRQVKESEDKASNIQKNQESEIKHFTKAAENELMGTYKRTVVDSFTKTFANNYEDEVDYNTLSQSLTFKMEKDNKGGLLPSYSFNPNKVTFKNIENEKLERFNENSKSDFVSNEDTIKGNNLSRFMFDNIEEYEAYESGDYDSGDLQDLEGQFISTSVEPQWGKFNKINKLKGYTPTNKSGQEASKKSDNLWSGMKNRVLTNIIKKYKL